MTKHIELPSGRCKNERIITKGSKTEIIAELDKARFWSKVEITDTCWIWKGYISVYGYGVFGIGAIIATAHRVSYSLIHGPIPKDLYVLHKCDNRACVNPHHLYAGTHQDNMTDMMVRKRGVHGCKKSVYRGVIYRPDIQKWKSYFSRTRNKKTTKYYFGVYSTEIEAAKKFDEGITRLGLTDVPLNFPEQP